VLQLFALGDTSLLWRGGMWTGISFASLRLRREAGNGELHLDRPEAGAYVLLCAAGWLDACGPHRIALQELGECRGFVAGGDPARS
jgi:hypothetical protein